MARLQRYYIISRRQVRATGVAQRLGRPLLCCSMPSWCSESIIPFCLLAAAAQVVKVDRRKTGGEHTDAMPLAGGRATDA